MKKAYQIFKVGAKYTLKLPFSYTMWLIFKLCTIAIFVYFPAMEAKIIDTVTYEKDISKFVKLLLIILSMYIIYYLLGYIFEYLGKKLETKSAYFYMRDVISHLQKSSMIYLSSHDNTYFASRIYDASCLINRFFIWVTSDLPKILITVAYPIYMITKANYKLTILLLILIAFNVLAYRIMKKPVYNATKRNEEERANFVFSRTEQFTSSKFVKTHGLYDTFIERMDKNFGIYLKTSLKVNLVRSKYKSLSDIISIIAKIAAYAFMGMSVLRGELTIGLFVMLIQYSELILSTVGQLNTISADYQKFEVSFDKMKEFTDVYSHKDGEKEINHINSIEVENLNFDYGDKTIFKDYNFNIEKGKIYGLLGENGAGKSALINLILGLYMGDYSGKICYNNTDIKDINLTKCKQTIIGMTEQEPLLVKDTLYNNICLDNKYDKDKIYEYGKMIGLSSYFDKLPDGLDTEINDKSTNISGGEKQKISILRQFLKNPDVMIFDEPTSALDIDSAKLFLNHIQSIKEDKIIIMISHDENIKSIYDEIISLANMGTKLNSFRSRC